MFCVQGGKLSYMGYCVFYHDVIRVWLLSISHRTQKRKIVINGECLAA